MRRFVLAAAVAAAACIPTTAAQARSSDACADADAVPDALTVRQARAATVCLLNAERRRHGLSRLRRSPGLALAGQRHARDMVARRYFAHTSRFDGDFASRIRRTGYLARGSRALIGENLASGSGRLATPRAIVRGWMRSSGHRANVLNAAYREVGIGVVASVPGRPSRGATYAAEFGRRF